MPNEKLDTFSKILLATQSINYMANCVNGVLQQYKMIPTKDEVITKGITDKENALFTAEKHLVKVMEELGDFMNDAGFSMQIDDRVTREAFSILHGKDDVEK